MSSDEESANNEPMLISDNEQPINEVSEVEEVQPNVEETEEVVRDEDAEDENNEKTTVKPKRVIRNPQPKLNAETLKGPKGIAALESYFDRVKFKGKGNEQQDLNVILKTYEYWCHRLFPKFPFDTCIERLEKLGNKKAVQTHIKRIRYDLFEEDKPIIDDSDEEPNVEGFVDIENNEINQQQNAQFDQLISSSAPVPNNTPVELTNEQLERIRLNKERAARLKQERLEKIRNKASENLQVSSQLPGTSGLHSKPTTEQFESTQSDVFSQDTLENASENTIIDGDILFDHESTIKGKASIIGSSIKKKSSKYSAVLDTSSESSQDEDMKHTNGIKETNMVSTTGEVLNIEQNSSDTNFTHKRKNKSKFIAASDESSDEKEKHMNKPKSIDIEHMDEHDTVDLNIEEHSGDSDFTQKRQHKRADGLLNIDQNSSHTNFTHERKNKGKFIADSDESSDEKHMNKARSIDIEHIDKHDTGDLNIEEHSSDSNFTQKKQNKRNHIIDSDEDQSGEEENFNKFRSKSKNNGNIPEANSDEENFSSVKVTKPLLDNGNIEITEEDETV